MDERGASSTDPARDEPNYCLLVLSVQKNVCVLLNHSNLSATELKVEIHRSTVSQMVFTQSPSLSNNPEILNSYLICAV